MYHQKFNITRQTFTANTKKKFTHSKPQRSTISLTPFFSSFTKQNLVCAVLFEPKYQPLHLGQ